MLKSPSGVPPGLKAAHYKSELRKLQNPEDCRCLDKLPPRIHSRTKIVAVKSKIDVVDFAGGSSSDEDAAKPAVDEVAGEDPASSSVVPAVVDEVAGEDPASSSSKSSTSSSSSSSSDASMAGGSDLEDDGPEVDAPWPTHLAGVLVRIVREDLEHVYAERLRVPCPNPEHGRRCHVSRSVRLDVPALGPRGVLQWLQCWLAEAFVVTEAQHRKFKPTVADVRAWRAVTGAACID